ncbi:MAG TPA: hypothetical protein VGD05_00610 [Pyrinomonadaceae bacterium]
MLVENVKKVEQLWKKQGLNSAKPLSEIDLIKSFSILASALSKDVIDVYSNLGGMADDDIDAICFTFWTVEKILAENKPNSQLTFFADFLIYSHLYGFKFENENISSIHIYWGENQIEKIADSFSEFFENYLTKPEKYFLFGRED